MKMISWKNINNISSPDNG